MRMRIVGAIGLLAAVGCFADPGEEVEGSEGALSGEGESGCEAERQQEGDQGLSECSDRDTIAAALDRLNAQAKKDGLRLRATTKADVDAWLDDFLPIGVIPAERRTFAAARGKGELPAGYRLALDTERTTGTATLELQLEDGQRGFSAVIVRGTSISLYTDQRRQACEDPATCNEPYAGTLPPTAGRALSSTVEVRVTEKSAPGNCQVTNCERAVLDVAVRANTANSAAIAEYFGQGFGSDAVRTRVTQALAGAGERWIAVDDLLPNWVAKRANTYPGKGDNDVCHGPARQFYGTELDNGRFSRSTDAVIVLLKDHYCAVAPPAAPTFGDYLYVPGRHSGRFVLEDPKTHRWIGFSVQSGGGAPYRFWWVDEDFSGKAFARTALPDFRDRLVDVWRRCR